MIHAARQCVGGPLHGKYHKDPVGSTKFQVIIGPPLDWESDVVIRREDVDVFTYKLIQLDGHLTWVCQ